MYKPTHSDKRFRNKRDGGLHSDVNWILYRNPRQAKSAINGAAANQNPSD